MIPSDLLMPAFRSFQRIVLNKSSKFTSADFANTYWKYQNEFLRQNRVDEFCKDSHQFAKELISDDRQSFAGIIYGYLCKITNRAPEELEEFAKNGCKVANKNGDYIHLLARF